MNEWRTKRKIALARVARRVVMLGRKAMNLDERASVQRDGIHWDLDLSEGIDFAIFLLGGFELRTLRLYRRLVQPGDTVLDIGANIGAHALPLARLVGASGRVVAFEPTQFAFRKLQRNLELNPELASRVIARQVALLDSTSAVVPDAIYSSWPLGTVAGLHEVHQGRLCTTRGARSATLDQEVEALGLQRIDFVKLDVDGHEPDVLAGAERTIDRFRPRILMEWAPYLFAGREALLECSLGRLRSLGYRARSAASGEIGEVPLDRTSLFKPLADGASINLLLENG